MYWVPTTTDNKSPLLMDEVIKPWQGHQLQMIMSLLKCSNVSTQQQNRYKIA